jgi:hypothetical protein
MRRGQKTRTAFRENQMKAGDFAGEWEAVRKRNLQPAPGFTGQVDSGGWFSGGHSCGKLPEGSGVGLLALVRRGSRCCDYSGLVSEVPENAATMAGAITIPTKVRPIRRSCMGVIPSGGVRSCSTRTHPHHDHDPGNQFRKSHEYLVAKQDSGSGTPTNEGERFGIVFTRRLPGCGGRLRCCLIRGPRRSHRWDLGGVCPRRRPRRDARAPRCCVRHCV